MSQTPTEAQTQVKFTNRSTPTNPGVYVIETSGYDKKFILLAKKDKLITPSGAIPLDPNTHSVSDIVAMCIKYNCYGWRWQGESETDYPPGGFGDEGTVVQRVAQLMSYKKLVR